MTDKGELRRVGLVGVGIGSSLSPRLHAAEAKALGFRVRYDLLDAGRLREQDPVAIIHAARTLGYAGLNVTHPFKQAVVPAMDELSANAVEVGAVNTVVFADDGRLVGHNTDVTGFAGLVDRRVGDIAGQRVIQIGAGGAGSAVAVALLRAGVGVLDIRDMDAARARALAESMTGPGSTTRVVHGGLDGLDRAVSAADGVVNATFVGMDGHPGIPLPVEALDPSQWLVDVIYFPLRTQLLAAAEERGLRAVGGSLMTALQAAEAFRLICGVDPDEDRMVAHMDSLVAQLLPPSRPTDRGSRP